jgi:hypothetical protein
MTPEERKAAQDKRIADAVKEVVDRAPPLSERQKDRIRQLLKKPGT